MSKDILGSLVRVLITVPNNRLGLLQDIGLKLSNDDGDQWEQSFKQFLRKKPCWTNSQVTQVVEPKSTPSILELVNPEIKVSARDHFVVADNFKKGNAGIHYLTENFQKWFGNKIEGNVPAATLSSRELIKGSVDGPIKAELGENHEIFLAWIFEKIESQADGREGDLLVNGYANIFYIDGVRVVRAYWSVCHGWYIHAREVGLPYAWGTGYMVFSRNLVLASSVTVVA